MPSVVLLFAVVGFATVLQQTPRVVTEEVPILVTFPPDIAVVLLIPFAAVLVTIGDPSMILVKERHPLAALYALIDPAGTYKIHVLVFTFVKTDTIAMGVVGFAKIEVNPEHSLKAKLPIEVTELGMVMLISPPQ